MHICKTHQNNRYLNLGFTNFDNKYFCGYFLKGTKVFAYIGTLVKFSRCHHYEVSLSNKVKKKIYVTTKTIE